MLIKYVTQGLTTQALFCSANIENGETEDVLQRILRVIVALVKLWLHLWLFIQRKEKLQIFCEDDGFSNKEFKATLKT